MILLMLKKDFEIKEELASMQSLKGTTKGNDLFVGVNKSLQKLGLQWKKLTLCYN